MRPSEIANMATPGERQRAIEEYAWEVHLQTKKLVDSFMSEMATFVEDYRNMRRKQVQFFKTKDQGCLAEAKQMEKALDQKAAKLFQVKQPGLGI